MNPLVRAVLLFASCLAAGAAAQEPGESDLVTLNAEIGADYQAIVAYDELVQRALDVRLVVYGEVHDQPEAARQFLRLAESLRQRSPAAVRFGIEFVDRGDWDLLARYLDRSLDESGFLARISPSSMLLLPEIGAAHLQVLRYARRHGIDVLPLESRPAGVRPLVLRDSEIRWNLSTQLGRHATERLLVLYGVQHVVGPDAVTRGILVPTLTVTAYGDSVLETFARREGRYPAGGEVMRLGLDLYLQAVGGPPRSTGSPGWDPGARAPLLLAIEASYTGAWQGMALVIDALLDPDLRWRRAAFHALRQAAERSFGYDPEADTAARVAAHERWLEWWQETEKRTVGAR